MPKPNYIELGDGSRVPILYEDRSVIAVDKPAGWMLVPYSWQKTNRNLHAAIVSSIAEGAFWARSRGIKFLQHVHRLDAETTGVLLLARSRGAVDTISDLFESRQMEKRYLVVARGTPKQAEWNCQFKLAPDPHQIGRMIVDEVEGKESETRFKLLQCVRDLCLLDAFPYTGRTHQIRIHAAQSGHPVVGDMLYGREAKQGLKAAPPLGLRATSLGYVDPFNRQRVQIEAPSKEFMRQFGFRPSAILAPPKDVKPPPPPQR